MKPRLLIPFLYVCSSACGQPVQNKPAIANTDTSYVYRSPLPDGTGKYYMGRAISQVMGSSGADWLERPQRQTEENVDLAIKNMKLAPESVVADIGAGTGYFSFRIAAQVPKGKVYAVELQNEMIDLLNDKINQTGLQNVNVIKGDTLQVNLPANSVDLAIMVDVYHELAWPREIIRSISNCLKPDGKILLIEYRGEDPSVPIKALHKTTVAQLSMEMNANGFVLDRRGDFLPIQHFLLFRKKP